MLLSCALSACFTLFHTFHFDVTRMSLTSQAEDKKLSVFVQHGRNACGFNFLLPFFFFFFNSVE